MCRFTRFRTLSAVGQLRVLKGLNHDVKWELLHQQHAPPPSPKLDAQFRATSPSFCDVSVRADILVVAATRMWKGTWFFSPAYWSCLTKCVTSSSHENIPAIPYGSIAESHSERICDRELREPLQLLQLRGRGTMSTWENSCCHRIHSDRNTPSSRLPPRNNSQISDFGTDRNIVSQPREVTRITSHSSFHSDHHENYDRRDNSLDARSDSHMKGRSDHRMRSRGPDRNSNSKNVNSSTLSSSLYIYYW